MRWRIGHNINLNNICKVVSSQRVSVKRVSPPSLPFSDIIRTRSPLSFSSTEISSHKVNANQVREKDNEPFTPREKIATSWSFSRRDRGRALFLQLPSRLTTSSNTVFIWSFGVDIGPITPHYNFVFVPNLFARLELKWSVPSPQNRPHWRGSGTRKAFWEFRQPFYHFLTERECASHFLIGLCSH